MNLAVYEETIRRHVTSIGYVSFVVLTALAGILAATFNTPASLWPSMVTLLSVITGSALVGPEFSTGTLQLVVSRPVRRPVYVVSRAAGVLTSVAIAALAGAAGELSTRVAGGRVIAAARIATVFAGSLVVAFLAVAILSFLGSVTRAYFNVAIYIGAQAALSMLETFLGIARLRSPAVEDLLQRFDVEQMLISFDDAFFPSVPPVVTGAWALRTTAMAALFLALACFAFSRREVPYGAD